MKPRHQVTRAAIDLIKAFEGYRRKAARLANGRWTIGYGHTLTAREGAEVSEKDAEALLTYDLIAVAHAVNDQTYTPLTQNQFDALCAFAFNIGLEKFRVCSVLRLVNQGQLLQAACAMELWRKADFQGERIVIDALVRRRAAEKNLFLTPTDGWVPAPSPILPPNMDTDPGGVPGEKPAVVTTPLEGPDALAEREPQPFSDGLTATQRAAAAVTSRLQKMFPDQPEAAPPAPEPVAVNKAWPLASATEQAPLPPPAWPLSFGGANKPVLVAPPTDQDLEPDTPLSPEMDLEAGLKVVADPVRAQPILPVAANEQDDVEFVPPAEPETPSNDPPAAVEPWIDEAPAEPARAGPLVPDLILADPVQEPPPRDLAPLVGLGLLGLVLFLGGLAWSGAAKEGGGPFNPWVVGTLSCLAGVGFMAVSVYFLLLRLGRVDRPADSE
jgi:lysozyme